MQSAERFERLSARGRANELTKEAQKAQEHRGRGGPAGDGNRIAKSYVDLAEEAAKGIGETKPKMRAFLAAMEGGARDYGCHEAAKQYASLSALLAKSQSMRGFLEEAKKSVACDSDEVGDNKPSLPPEKFMPYQNHGDHWGCLSENVEEFVQRLSPLMLTHGRCIDPHPSDRRSGSDGILAAGESIGLVWPESPLCGLSVISGLEESGAVSQVLMSSYPFVITGARYTLTVMEIIPWSNGVEAWIKACPPNSEGPLLTFFDTRYYAYRDRLRIGQQAEFALAGLVYAAEVVHPEPILITDPDAIRKLRVETSELDEITPMELQTEGAAILLPGDEEEAPDDYQFQGPVKAVETVTVFDQSITRFTATVARLPKPGDADIDLDIELYVANHAWRTEERPVWGSDVRGYVWLQGCLVDAALGRS